MNEGNDDSERRATTIYEERAWVASLSCLFSISLLTNVKFNSAEIDAETHEIPGTLSPPHPSPQQEKNESKRLAYTFFLLFFFLTDHIFSSLSSIFFLIS